MAVILKTGTRNKDQLRNAHRVFLEILTFYRDLIIHNAKFFKRFFAITFLNISLIGLLIEFTAIGIKAYDAAWGLSQHQFYVYASWACGCIVAILFIFTIVLNFRIMWLRINEEYKGIH